MQIIADLQIHSKFSRAVSKEMTLPNIAMWAKRKGINLMATGDWTHPMWFREIERDLEELGNGLLQLKTDGRKQKAESRNQPSALRPPLIDPNFMLATEVSSIYTQNGKGRRVHTLIWVPSLDSARKISQEMTKQGCNLLSDGRPIIRLSCIQIAELVLTIEPKALVFPAHTWTPWFSTYGSMSGFNSIAEAYGPYAKNVYAIETGLSSSPEMNWRIKELDHRAIVSFSDAHSGPKIGREATVFEIPDGKLSYDAIYEAIRGNQDRGTKVGSTHAKISFTIEFYPEEGKYHYTGHRTCNIRYKPEETVKKGSTCPVCGKPLTQGVMQRVEELAGRSEADLKITPDKIQLTADGGIVRMIKSSAFPKRPPFVMLVPLQEIISECIGSPVASKKTQAIYLKLTDYFNGEFSVLLKVSKDDITKVADIKIATAIEKVRFGDIVVDPGYDGVFGIVKIWKDEKEKALVDKSKEQISIF
jgi:PHP family Zn ribbon phosphoesterase